MINHSMFHIPSLVELVRKVFFDLLTHDYIGPVWALISGWIFFPSLDVGLLSFIHKGFFSASPNLSKHSIHSRLTLYLFTNSH